MQTSFFLIIILILTNLSCVEMSNNQNHEIIIYTTSYCPYCVKAKNLLKSKNLAFQEINVEKDDLLKEKMIEKSGGKRTVPQIFIGKKHIGGCDDLHALEASGKLDEILHSVE